MPMPAAIRKKSDLYSQNIHKRGLAKKSRAANTAEEKSENAEEQQQLQKPESVANQRAYIILLVLILGSLAVPLLSPFLL